MTDQRLDLVERDNPELIRLRDKLERLDAWLDDHANEIGTERWQHRQDVWFSTLRRYERVYDVAQRRIEVAAVREAERHTQGRML